MLSAPFRAGAVSAFLRRTAGTGPIFVCWHHVWIKAQNILITDAVRNAVPVQLIAEHIRSSAHFLLIFIVDRRAGKAKKMAFRKVS